MLHSIGAVVAGYALMVVLVMVGTMGLTATLVPGGLSGLRDRMQAGQGTALPSLPLAYLVGNIVLSLVAAIASGYVTLQIAQPPATGHLVALGVVLLVMGALSARMPGSNLQPGWYRISISLVGVLGVALSLLLARA